MSGSRRGKRGRRPPEHGGAAERGVSVPDRAPDDGDPPVAEPEDAAADPAVSGQALHELAGMRDDIETALLGSTPALTRREVAERTGMDPEASSELWRLLGFPQVDDDEVAFTELDVEALALNRDLWELGVIDQHSQAAQVRTWGRSFARLAEWQTDLLARVALASPEPADRLTEMLDEVLPRVERLQSYIWRRHMVSAVNRQLAVGAPDRPAVTSAVCFVDIVGYTTRSKNLDERELVEWVERFEGEATRAVVDAGGRVIKTIGDEILFIVDEPVAAAEVVLALVERGADPEDGFPQVRAGLSYGDVVNRLGDVYGPTVNIAARLTSIARPDTVLVDRTMHDALSEDEGARDTGTTLPDAAAAADRMRELLGLPEVQRAVGAEGGEEASSGTERPADPGAADRVWSQATGTPLDVVRVSPDEPTAVLSAITGEGDEESQERFRFKKLRRVSVKGYSRLETWAVRRPREGSSRKDRGRREEQPSEGAAED